MTLQMNIKNIILLLFVFLTHSSCYRSAHTNIGEVTQSSRKTIIVEGLKIKEEPLDIIIKLEYPKLISTQPQQIIEHLAYTVSHNPVWNIPNWVAYSLTDTELRGDIPRARHFYPDPKVQGVAVVPQDYTHSGYDRGHMAPAADMKWSEQAMRESFYMTNICPQNQNLNRGDWNDLEELARDWARKFGNLYIACGPIVHNEDATIGNNHRIVIPSAFYKVFLRKDNSSWTSIGFIFANESGNKPLMTYMVSIDEVESTTGIDFFYNLPDSIENEIEKDFNLRDWTVQ